MRKVMLIAAGLALVFASVADPLPDGGPYKETIDGVEWTYGIKNGAAYVGYGWKYQAVLDSASGEVSIPERLGECDVVGLSVGAFFRRSNITQVKIPSSVTNIEEGAFEHCSGLISVVLSSELSSIGDFAFHACENLKSISMPISLKGIGQSAFKDCNSMTKITIPSSVINIGANAMYGCSSLNFVDFAGAPPGGVNNAQIRLGATIRYNAVYADRWLPIIKSCGWTNVQANGVQLWENGPLWADSNVGASDPEEVGYYFWWGDVVGYERNANNDGWVARDGSGKTHKFTSQNASENAPTYGKTKGELVSLGYSDDGSSGVLNAAHDAATQYLGADWRMPTFEELQELAINCTTSWTVRNGVYGRLVTGRGVYAAKSIFIPVAGYGKGDNLVVSDSYNHPQCWTSTPDFSYSRSLYAYVISFDSGFFGYGNFCREYGLPVRPVFGRKKNSIIFSNISYENLRGATHSNPSTYQEGTVTSFSLPQGGPVGYAFAGWTPSAITADMTSDQTVIANWTAIPYAISYLGLKGAVNSNSATYTIEDSVTFSPLANIANFAFAGWTPSSISKGSTGDKIVTALWTWTPQNAIVESSITGGAKLAVDAEWVTTHLAQRFGDGKQDVFRSKFGDDLAEALKKKTGKRDCAGNELEVWHDYVAGTDPTDSNSVFTAKVRMEGGLPIIEWEPNLNENGEERVYTVFGKADLKDAWHSPTNGADRFFKVSVAMPEGNVITLSLGGGSCDADPLVVSPGDPLGTLPEPTRDGYLFDGWYTSEEGGDKVTAQTIAVEGMTIYARWKNLGEGLVHRWSFNGSLNDSVGGQTATVVGNVTTDGNKYISNAGSSGTSYIDLGDWILPTNGLPVTIEMWAACLTAQNYQRIFEFGSMPSGSSFSVQNTSKYSKDSIAINRSGECVCFDGAHSERTIVNLDAFSVGREYYIAVVIEPLDNGRWKISYYQQDAATGDTLSQVGVVMDQNWSIQSIKQTEMLLGQPLTTWDRCFNNSYNELRIWNRALTDDELTRSAKAGPDNLVL